MFKTLKGVTKLIISEHDANSYINKQVFFLITLQYLHVVRKSMESKKKMLNYHREPKTISDMHRILLCA